MRGEANVETPIHLVKGPGSKLYNAVHCDVGVQLFHNRFFDILSKAGVTGFDSLPAAITIKGQTINDYSCLIVTGRAYGIDYHKGEVIDKGPIVPGGSSIIVKKGLYFNETSWDGSDFFLLDDTLLLMVTEKVKEVIQEHKLTNIKLTDSEEVEDDIHHLSVRRPELLQFYHNQLVKKANVN
jgi:hypothetical protein